MIPARNALWGLGLSFSSFVISAEEFTFDISEFEKKPYELNGYGELNYQNIRLNQSSAAYVLNFINQSGRESIDRSTGVIELTGKYNSKKFSAATTVHSQYQHDYLDDNEETQLYEGFIRYQPNSQLAAELGKRALRWGKGYAWNPVGFVERPKDPNDPELSREGYVVVALDYIRSYSTDLKTIAVSPVLLPVTQDINNDYAEDVYSQADSGITDEYNLAAKVYFLYKDTDIDLLVLGDGSRSARYGVDISRNITTNFEVHGEWARISDLNKALINSAGEVSQEEKDADQLLLGLRYLSEDETTYILEYYYNSAGYSVQQMQTFYQGVKDAHRNNDTALLKIYKSAASDYLQRNPGRQYMYLRLSNKEPFDVLYFTPALTVIYNMEDHSYSLTPEFVYAGVDNLELRLKAFLLFGGEFTEFGEKQNDNKLEIRARYYF